MAPHGLDVVLQRVHQDSHVLELHAATSLVKVEGDKGQRVVVEPKNKKKIGK